MICKLCRWIGIPVWHEKEIIQGIKELQEQQATQEQPHPAHPAPVLTPVHGRGEFVKVNANLRRDK